MRNSVKAAGSDVFNSRVSQSIKKNPADYNLFKENGMKVVKGAARIVCSTLETISKIPPWKLAIGLGALGMMGLTNGAAAVPVMAGLGATAMARRGMPTSDNSGDTPGQSVAIMMGDLQYGRTLDVNKLAIGLEALGMTGLTNGAAAVPVRAGLGATAMARRGMPTSDNSGDTPGQSVAIMMGDLQYGRTLDVNNPRHEQFCSTNNDDVSKDCRERSLQGISEYRESITKLHNQEETAGKNVGIILGLGDNTEYSHASEVSVVAEELAKFPDDVSVKVHLGGGNHDIANNVDDCFNNNCASRGFEIIANQCLAALKEGGNCDLSEECLLGGNYRILKGSAAYSLDKDGIHFVQLHNYPTYRNQWVEWLSHPNGFVDFLKRFTFPWGEWKISNLDQPLPTECIAWMTRFDVTSSEEFLKKDLPQASGNGTPIVVVFHDPGEHFTDGYSKQEAAQSKADLRTILEENKVSAVFAAHLHDQVGRTQADPAVYGNIPVFQAGSAMHRTYLKVDFNPQQKIGHVTIMNATGGEAIPQSAPDVFELFTGA